MIRTEAEYKEAHARLKSERGRMQDQRHQLREKGYTEEQIDTLMQPLLCFHMQLAEEVEAYEKLCRGEFEALKNLAGLGRLLIGARIYLGLTQKQLAEKLGVSEAQVSRDERNEYHNITIDRAERILEALGVILRTSVELPPAPGKNAEAVCA